MSIMTDSEVFYWGEIPVGATVITSCARKIEGQMVYQAAVKNDGEVMGYQATTIPLRDVRPGQPVYVAPPSSVDSILIDLPWRLTEWTPQTQSEIRQAITQTTLRQPLRGVVPLLLEHEPVVVTEGLSDLPAECFIVVGRKAASVRQEPSFGVWRRWTDPDGTSRSAMTTQDCIPLGSIAYVRADYLESGEPIKPETLFAGHTFLPLVWSQEALVQIAWDMTCRTPLDRRTVRKMRIDRLFLWINIVVLGLQGAIMFLDSDKRGAPKQIAWTALVGTAAWSSKQTVAENEWFMAERMR